MDNVRDFSTFDESPPTTRSGLGARGGLPRPLSSLVGRETELADIEARLTSSSVRLLTLTGPGGVGKTRLAIESGNRLAGRYRDGAGLVPLAQVQRASQVIPAIGKTIGPRRADTTGMADVIGVLRHAHMLLILDNFEHVLDGAIVVSELLTACPEVTALVTSRSLLHLSGEHVYPIPPMRRASPTAPPEEILATDAAQLFIDRANAAAAHLSITPDATATIAAICERLEGMPLAIELAAAHASTFSLDEILERLGERLAVLARGPRDQPERLRTMRAAIAWGYELLGAQERRLLRRLAMFEGGFGLEIVEALLRVDAPEDAPPDDPLAFLERLVSQSFIRHIITPAGFSRYVILEVVREFLLAQVVASGEAEAVERIRLATCLDFAREAASHLVRTVDPAWIDRLEMEHATIVSALRWGFDASFLDVRRQAAQLAGQLWLFWYYHGHLATARHWLERATELGSTLGDAERARIHLGLGTILHYQGEMERAGAELARALHQAEATGHRHLVAYVLAALGNHAEDLGQYSVAQEHFAAARDRFREENDPVNVAVTLYHLGVAAFGKQDLEQATDLLHQALHLARDTGDPWSTGAALAWLGLVHLMQGEIDDAAAALEDALSTFVRIGSSERVAELLRRTALLAAARSSNHDAVRLFATASVLSDHLGSHPRLPESRIYDDTLERLRQRLPSRAFTAAWNAGRDLSQAEAVELAKSVLAASSAATVAPQGTPTRPNPLSDRETEVLRLIAEGMTDADIADALSISRRTAATHVRHIYDKISVTSRAAAAAWAVRNGIA